MDKSNVKDEIRSAFEGVKLGDGIGLWEAQAIDDYETGVTQKRFREKDEKEDWTKFNKDQLQRCHSSLSFFDANGMRFHLPAYILASLDEKVDDPLFHLEQLDDDSLSRFSTFSKTQKLAVVTYLKWCLNQDDYKFDHPAIERALSEYWEK